MGRGPLRLRSSSAHKRGIVHLGYLRELTFVALLMGVVLSLQQAFQAPVVPSNSSAHSTQPVYGMGLDVSGRTLWVARERYGISHIDLAAGLETDHWMLFQSEASFVAQGGQNANTTIRFGMDRRVDLIRGNETIHSEQLPMEFEALSDSDISRDGRFAVAVSNSSDMLVWTIDNETSQVETSRHNVPQQLDHVSISRDGKMLALVNWESVYLWNRDEAKITASWKTSHGAKPTLRGNRTDTLAWSPDGTRLALGFDDGLVRVWETHQQSLLWEHQADLYKASAVTFDSTGTKLATGGFDKHVRIWDLDHASLIWERSHHQQSIHNLIFTDDDNRLYSGGLDGKVCEWAAASGTLLRDLP